MRYEYAQPIQYSTCRDLQHRARRPPHRTRINDLSLPVTLNVQKIRTPKL